MSDRLFEDDVLFLQRLLKCSGFYTGKLDGDWGKKTDAAMTAFDAEFKKIADKVGTFNTKSEIYIHKLQPKAQELARRTLKAIRAGNIDARIISGTRTYEEQNALYRQGRFGNPPPIVTNARGGQSNHNFGIAWDIGIFSANGSYLGESPLYKKAGEIALNAGLANLEWGGKWVTFVDRPHYQVATGLQISKIREKFEAGTPFI